MNLLELLSNMHKIQWADKFLSKFFRTMSIDFRRFTTAAPLIC